MFSFSLLSAWSAFLFSCASLKRKNNSHLLKLPVLLRTEFFCKCSWKKNENCFGQIELKFCADVDMGSAKLSVFVDWFDRCYVCTVQTVSPPLPSPHTLWPDITSNCVCVCVCVCVSGRDRGGCEWCLCVRNKVWSVCAFEGGEGRESDR